MKQSGRSPLQARAQALGITLVERDVIPSSRRAHECTEYARERDKLPVFHASVLKAYWTQGRDIHDWAVLEEIAHAAGLDGKDMREQVAAGQYKHAVDERVEAAHELGVHAVPTFLFADRFAVEGAQTFETFDKVMQRVLAG